MKVEVRYVTKGGNTRKVAEAIAAAVATVARDQNTAISEQTDVLFLGASIYAGGIAKEMKQFIEELPADKIGKVYVFSTAAGDKSALPQIKELLEAKGIAVSAATFHCRGSFLLANRGRPNEKDLHEAEEFARKAIA